MASVRPLILFAIWGAATFGILALERTPGDYSHALCGPWG
jgi:hypothetical protein